MATVYIPCPKPTCAPRMPSGESSNLILVGAKGYPGIHVDIKMDIKRMDTEDILIYI